MNVEQFVAKELSRTHEYVLSQMPDGLSDLISIIEKMHNPEWVDEAMEELEDYLSIHDDYDAVFMLERLKEQHKYFKDIDTSIMPHECFVLQNYDRHVSKIPILYGRKMMMVLDRINGTESNIPKLEYVDKMYSAFRQYLHKKAN